MADHKEFDAFVVAQYRSLLRMAYLLVRDRYLAEDLVQTALTKSWFAWSRINGDPVPYVRRVVVATSLEGGGADRGPARAAYVDDGVVSRGPRPVGGGWSSARSPACCDRA